VPGGADQVALLLDEAINRPLVRGPVDPLIGDLGHPLPKLLVEVDVVDEPPPRQEVAAEVFHPGLDFALRLGAIGLTQPRLEAPIVGEASKGRVPQDPPLRRALADGARSVIEMLVRVAAEILELTSFAPSIWRVSTRTVRRRRPPAHTEPLRRASR